MINPYWPLAALECAEKYRQARLSAFRFAACCNPVLAWWLATRDSLLDQPA